MSILWNRSLAVLAIHFVMLPILVTTAAGQKAVKEAKQTGSQDRATITVVSRSLPYDLVEPALEKGSYRYQLRSADGTREIPFVGRKVVKGDDGTPEYQIDTYRILAPEGFYRIVLPNFEDLRLANFFVPKGESTTVQLPVSRFAYDEVCIDGIRQFRPFGLPSGKGDDRARERSDMHPIRTQLLVPFGSYELVLRYCEMTREGPLRIFKSSEAYFNNQFVSGRTIVYDPEKRVLKVKGDAYLSAYFQGQDGMEKEGDSITLFLRP